ncbi:MAG: DinB family protein [Thermomicrobiales bacterium]
MPKAPLTPDEILTLLRAHPGQFAALTAGLTPARLRTPPEPEAWALTGILAHLRACADVWGDVIATMLANDRPTIRAINPRAWIERTDYQDLAFAPSFAAYTAQRASLLTTLDALTLAQWERDATVTGAGAPLTRTVYFYAQWLARHERSHLNKIARVAETVRR